MLNKRIITGLILGAAFALIFAPQKGRLVREKIQKAHDKGDDVIEPIGNGLWNLVSEANRALKARLIKLNRKTERNPFTITNIYHYVGKKS